MVKKIVEKVLTTQTIWIILTKQSQENDFVWGLSSAGRASALQAEGHRFEPCRPHQYGGIAQLARAHGSYPWCREFKSPFRYLLISLKPLTYNVFGDFSFPTFFRGNQKDNHIHLLIINHSVYLLHPLTFW